MHRGDNNIFIVYIVPRQMGILLTVHWGQMGRARIYCELCWNRGGEFIVFFSLLYSGHIVMMITNGQKSRRVRLVTHFHSDSHAHNSECGDIQEKKNRRKKTIWWYTDCRALLRTPLCFFFWLGAARAKISLFLDGGGLLICVENLSFFQPLLCMRFHKLVHNSVIFPFLNRNFAFFAKKPAQYSTRYILAQ